MCYPAIIVLGYIISDQPISIQIKKSLCVSSVQPEDEKADHWTADRDATVFFVPPCSALDSVVKRVSVMTPGSFRNTDSRSGLDR